MERWSTSSKVVLAAASCAVFATVVLVAGHRPPVAFPEQPRASSAPPVSISPAVPPPEAEPTQSTPEKPAPSASASPPDDASIAELERQAMPTEETTAEENEQRGDAIRRLGSNATPETVPALVYALRNDVDIRNRILAIEGLRRAALAGNPERAITDALVEASSSGDEIISSQAGQALVEIEKRRSR